MQSTDVTRAVVANSVLWTAGNALTTCGFLNYFAYELGASSVLIALLAATPETVGILGLGARSILHRVGNRKRAWIACSLLARLGLTGIPLLAFADARSHPIELVWIMIGCLALAQAAQAVAWTLYYSWLSDLVPETRWGRFFAVRNIATLAVMLIVPVAAGMLRDRWKEHLPPNVALLVYAVTFGVGIALLFASMLPMLRLPNAESSVATADRPDWRLFGAALRDPQFRLLLGYSWHLAIASGLTQAAFIRYQIGVLRIPLTVYYLLFSTMLLVQIPVSWWAGRCCDRSNHTRPLLWGTLAAGLALPFWMLARAEQPSWLWPAYVMWGGFAAVNVAGQNLALKLSPRSDNTAHLALFRQVAGLLAGLSGILGGLWLDALLARSFSPTVAGVTIDGYRLLFLISCCGRLTATFWILSLREPADHPQGA